MYCRCMYSCRAVGCGARCVCRVWPCLGPVAPLSSTFLYVRRWFGSGRARFAGRLTAGLVWQEAAGAAAPSAPVAPSREEDAPASTSGSSDSGSDAREEVELLKGWRTNDGVRSLPEVNGTIAVPAASRPWFAQLAAFAGIGSMISVGYMVRLLPGYIGSRHLQSGLVSAACALAARADGETDRTRNEALACQEAGPMYQPLGAARPWGHARVTRATGRATSKAARTTKLRLRAQRTPGARRSLARGRFMYRSARSVKARPACRDEARRARRTRATGRRTCRVARSTAMRCWSSCCYRPCWPCSCSRSRCV